MTAPLPEVRSLGIRFILRSFFMSHQRPRRSPLRKSSGNKNDNAYWQCNQREDHPIEDKCPSSLLWTAIESQRPFPKDEWQNQDRNDYSD